MIPEDHLDFLHAVWTRRPLFTYIFFGVNILVFVLMALAGGSTNSQTLLAFGVKSNSEIAQGQWWRFVTPIFIHIGMLHLFFNSYALWIVGPQVEKLYGSERFAILYILTGAAGVFGSYYYHPAVPSAGASGAIFGLFGVLLVFGIRYRTAIPPFFKRAVGTGVLPVIVINLIIGFTIPQVDNAAHIGGLLAGAALASLVPYQRPGEEASKGFRSVQVALLAIVAICGYEVATHYDGPRLSPRNLVQGFMQIGGGSSIEHFIDAVTTSQNSFGESLKNIQSGSPAKLSRSREEISKSIDKLRKIPSLEPRVDKLMADLLRVMQDQYELIKNIEGSGAITLGHSLRLKDNISRYDKIMDEFSNWVDREGEKYGITR